MPLVQTPVCVIEQMQMLNEQIAPMAIGRLFA